MDKYTGTFSRIETIERTRVRAQQQTARRRDIFWKKTKEKKRKKESQTEDDRATEQANTRKKSDNMPFTRM